MVWFAKCLYVYFVISTRENNVYADVLPRLPLPATKADSHPDVQLSDPTDVEYTLLVRVEYIPPG